MYDNVSMHPCHCNGSPYVNDDHGHIVTGDLRIIKNGKLRKLFIKGPKYREPSMIDFSKARQCLNNGLNEFIILSSAKLKIDKVEFSEWKQKVLGKVDDKITFLQQRTKVNRTSKTLSDVSARVCLDELKEKYVLVPIDKAANNVGFVCKRFYN